jgi:hypothetical protein
MYLLLQHHQVQVATEAEAPMEAFRLCLRADLNSGIWEISGDDANWIDGGTGGGTSEFGSRIRALLTRQLVRANLDFDALRQSTAVEAINMALTCDKRYSVRNLNAVTAFVRLVSLAPTPHAPLAASPTVRFSSQSVL